MRTLLVIAILATSILAGCTNKGGGGHDDTFTCPNGKKIDISVYPDHDNATFNATSKCPKTNGTGGGNSTANSTSRGPNVLPNLVFATTDSTGNATNITLLGGNLTFDATGSNDPDGNITGLAMTVTDSNQTRTISLFDFGTKTFTPKQVDFDRAGIIKVSVAVVDDRGGFTTLNDFVFVDQAAQATYTFPGSAGTYNNQAGMMPNCSEALSAEDTTVASVYVQKNFAIDVVDNATWIEAKASGAANSISMVICTPANGTTPGTSISDRAQSVTTNPDIEIPPATGVAQYALWAYRVGAPAPTTVVTFTWTTHYGPRPAPA